MTPSLKLARPKLEQRFKDVLSKVYEEQEEAEQHKVKSHLENIFGGNQTADSLAAVRIQNLIRKDFHVEVPIQMILRSENPLEDVERFIKSPNNDAFRPATVDFEKEAEYELHVPQDLQPFSGSLKDCTNVLLTGATVSIAYFQADREGFSWCFSPERAPGKRLYVVYLLPDSIPF